MPIQCLVAFLALSLPVHSGPSQTQADLVLRGGKVVTRLGAEPVRAARSGTEQ